MAPRLDQPLDVFELAKQGVEWSLHIPLAKLKRLAPSLRNQHGHVEAALAFGYDQLRNTVVSGNASVDVEIQCQRCLDAMHITLNVDIALGVVASEREAQGLPDDLEPLIVGEEPVTAVQIVEDELLLALPLVARHVTCQAAIPEPPQVEPKQASPFEALRKLRKPGAESESGDE